MELEVTARVPVATAWCPWCLTEVYLSQIDHEPDLLPEETSVPVSIPEPSSAFVLRHYASQRPWRLAWDEHAWRTYKFLVRQVLSLHIDTARL